MASEGQKVVLITGCSSGIGLRIAVMLANDEKKRYYVIATMGDLKRKDRLLEAAGDAYGKTLALQTLDVCDDESVKQCIDSVKDRRVDVPSESLDPIKLPCLLNDKLQLPERAPLGLQVNADTWWLNIVTAVYRT